jgi:hypothetical protein
MRRGLPFFVLQGDGHGSSGGCQHWRIGNVKYRFSIGPVRFSGQGIDSTTDVLRDGNGTREWFVTNAVKLCHFSSRGEATPVRAKAGSVDIQLPAAESPNRTLAH